ncbi:MAG TPA: sugar transporter [Syntrophobacteraceae bacterium]|jgi:polysaccharide biosynthesis/export protein|nr:sugar transporter [Syntrophobacteraceae bacterium]HBD07188.1 sugar transporter [Syntrophobacteraceae bacterium]
MLKSESKRILVAALFLGFISFCVTGCGGPVVKQPVPLGSPQLQGPFPEQEYRLQVGDQLDVKFFYNPELNEAVVVRPDGRISLQLVHEVKAVDMTPAELRAQLMEKYSKDLAKPEVAVIVKAVGGNKVFVDGEVGGPKTVDLIGPMTVMQGIAIAGGLKTTARTDEVVLIRRGLDHKPVVTTINLAKVVDGTDLSQDLTLAPYDIVFVPRSKIADVALWFEMYMTKSTLVIPNAFLSYYGMTTR